MTPQTLQLADQLAEAFQAHVAAKLADVQRAFIQRGDSLAARIEQLEARVAALEERSALCYRGVYRDGLDYEPGSIATHAGQLWYCWEKTVARPGTSDDWQLMQKKTDAR